MDEPSIEVFPTPEKSSMDDLVLNSEGIGDQLEKNLISKKNSSGARLGKRKITQEEYNDLRVATPSRKIQKMVNKDIDKLIGTPDPALPGKTIEDTLQADHIVPMKTIVRMDGFNRLTREQQLQVLNNPKNFIGLSETANKSKGPKSYSEWTEYKKEGIKVDENFRREMIKKEKELERILQKQIDDLLGGK